MIVLFPIACGHLFCDHGASPNCENSNYKHYRLNVDMMDQKGAVLFGLQLCMVALQRTGGVKEIRFFLN